MALPPKNLFTGNHMKRLITNSLSKEKASQHANAIDDDVLPRLNKRIEGK